MKVSPLNPSALDEVLAILSRHFNTQIQIQSIVQLSEKERRNLVLRISIQNSAKNIPKSVILKQTLPDKTSSDNIFGRFARDWAALEFLNALKTDVPSTPKFYGGSLEHSFILMEDLGESHISLVDSLTCGDTSKAKTSLFQFMKTLGKLHACSYGRTEEYFKILTKITDSSDASNKAYHVQEDLQTLTALLKQINISLSDDVLSEIHRVFKAMVEPGPFTALIHGDICPDNVFDCIEKNEMYLIDFEWGSIKNALLDGLYLRMNFPTCWCAKAIPSQLLDPLESTYREELRKTIPAAKDDEMWNTAYLQASSFWMLKSILFLEKVLEKDIIGPSGPVSKKSLWNPEVNLVRPRVLSRLISFLEVSKRNNQLPHLESLATQVLKKLEFLWPNDKPLDLYPAFKD